MDKTRDIFERAIANVPPVAEKRSVRSPLVIASTCAAPLRGAPLSLALSLTYPSPPIPPPISPSSARYWRRYLYLWINYALFEELQVKDVDRTRAVYRACLSVVPHKAFTFGKVRGGALPTMSPSLVSHAFPR